MATFEVSYKYERQPARTIVARNPERAAVQFTTFNGGYDANKGRSFVVFDPVAACWYTVRIPFKGEPQVYQI